MNDLLEEGTARGLERFGRPALREALNQALDALRARWRSAGTAEPVGEAFWSRVEAVLAVTPALRLRRAINATGVVLHTGLGRAPWPMEAMAAANAAARNAVLEIEGESGRRGRRDAPVDARLRELTGAEAGLAVNNNAGAVLLCLSALARGRKVALARSEMVEIGGAYRMPAVVSAAGAELVEVGTTNRTRVADYREALADPEVTVLLRVHRSNFRLEGFTADAPARALAGLCRERGVAFVFDLGSGVLDKQEIGGVGEEHTVREALADGADLVTFSGDKLLGGPQAGLVVGAAPLVERLRRDVLTRCLRLDKTILAALEAVLSVHALGPEAARGRLPALLMLSVGGAELEARALALAERLAGVAGSGLAVEVVPCAGRVGSGAAPVEDLPGAGIAVGVEGLEAEEFARRLRMGEPPVFGRVQDGRVVLDLRTVAGSEERALVSAVTAATH